MIELGRRVGFVLREIRVERDTDFVTQFVNLRIYEGDLRGYSAWMPS
ncbi:MAG: hypothetical protein R3C05_19385 [Pirellulaceae bacterium]